MTLPARHITVGICTFRRLPLLPRLFEKLAALKLPEKISLSVAVVDNDAAGSARDLIAQLGQKYHLATDYEIETERNFARVRNHILRLAKGDLIAFIDDDEVPVADWLSRLLDTMEQCNADGVLGPVRPYFDEKPPAWLVKSRLCDRPVHPTGMQMQWNQCRSGNVLLKKCIFSEKKILFDARYATGGEDVDFFKRAMEAGCKFFWCEEAAAYELVPSDRLKKSYYLKRALLQGTISLKYADGENSLIGRASMFLKAVVATTIYTIALPFLWLVGGMPLFMRYLVKNCHHFSRALAILGVETVRSRNF
jgi:cellulose synthase/poly-beta-1,6-N-acetylglucosamine synthase-like glycosyltransferase